jgi:hypothetical protein
MLHSDLDCATATGAAVELLRDRSDQPNLVALGVEAAEAGPGVRESVEVLHCDEPDSI